MSALCAAGMMAFSTAMAAPTGIDAGADPAGQASGMRVPWLTTGQRNNSLICLSALLRFFSSAGVSVSMARLSGAELVSIVRVAWLSGNSRFSSL